MPTLLIKLRDGRIIKGKSPLHCILADENNIDFDDIINVGFIVKDNRVIWLNRKPN